MIYQRLAALFARYCAVHLKVVVAGAPLTGLNGEILGHVDRISYLGQRLVIEGWANAATLVMRHAGQRQDLTPRLQRPDVGARHPNLKVPNPGFSCDFAKGEGGVTLTLIRDGMHFVHPVQVPGARRLALARVRLLLPFLRDMARATPVLLHWAMTKDPADRSRLKQHLRFAAPVVSKAMQRLLFLQDCLDTLPEHRQMQETARLRPAALAHRAITIVLPVYNAFDLLVEVLDRVVRHTDLPWRLILIDDASTDPRMRPFLRQWTQGQTMTFPDRVTLLENKENQGFIRSVNAALKLAIDHGDHVVLLNSDALVPKGWATRLMLPLLTHDRVATVTPMSNDAEIFSAPVICTRTALAPGQADAIDAVAARMHPDAALADAPTGVGFCMAMSIDYLRRLPKLDTAFGRGYGEEVDWCQKALALGGRHLGLANLFVEHRGGTSFGAAEKQRLVARNNAEISRRYPTYDAQVQAFISDDPLGAPRLALAIAWAASQATAAIPIYLAHSMGGGADDYLTQRIARDMPQAALVLRVGTALRWQLELHGSQGVTRGATDDFGLIQRLLDPIDRLHIVYSCGAGDADPADLPARLSALRHDDRHRLEILIHDYLPISPSYTLLNSAGQYEGPPDPATKDAAHCHRRPNGDLLSLADWQAAWGELLNQADHITTFSKSSAAVFAASFPFARGKLRIVPHQMLFDLPRLPARTGAKRPVIGVLGNIGYQKGAAILRDLSHLLDRTGEAKLVALGQIDPIYPLLASSPVHGGYQRRDIPALAARYGITDWLIPSIWPETFSYTTHEAIATGLPVWCFDLGAQADAVRSTGIGGVLPLPDGGPDLQALVARILQSHAQATTPSPESRAA